MQSVNDSRDWTDHLEIVLERYTGLRHLYSFSTPIALDPLEPETNGWRWVPPPPINNRSINIHVWNNGFYITSRIQLSWDELSCSKRNHPGSITYRFSHLDSIIFCDTILYVIRSWFTKWRASFDIMIHGFGSFISNEEGKLIPSRQWTVLSGIREYQRGSFPLIASLDPSFRMNRTKDRSSAW